MKLRSKISLSNLLVNVLFLLIAGVSLYFIVQKAVFDELDEHLRNHKDDLIQRFEDQEITLNTVGEIGSLGTYEWIEIKPAGSDISPIEDSYSTITKSRFSEETQGRYRQLYTLISLDGQPYYLSIYEEITGWESIALSILFGNVVLLGIWFGFLFIGNEFIIQQILRPFFDTVSRLRTIRSENDFNTSFPEVSTEEFNKLNSALNDMLRQLESSFVKQKQFIQNASHELLTPLSIIRHKTDELLNNEKLDEETALEIHKIQQTTIRLKRLSNALLTISRVENKHYPIDGNIPVHEIIEQTLQELSFFCENKKIIIRKNYQSIPNIPGNAELFSSLIYNVLQNAVYHTPEGTLIELDAIQQDNVYMHLIIKDSGPGLTDEQTQHVFERFERSSPNDGTEHHGLGLAIVQSICILHGWQGYFEKGREKGAAFHLIVPL